jgi:hypothetical protein
MWVIQIVLTWPSSIFALNSDPLLLELCLDSLESV